MGSQSDLTFLVVGLGNPGPKYALTRHNVGFMVIDLISQRWPGIQFQSKFQGELAQANFDGKRVLLLKPQTYMNLSGNSVLEAVQFYKITPSSHVLVISDDVDLPVGDLRIRTKGGSGGHNGLKSITECLGTEEYLRMRIGVGRSPVLPTDEHVLGKIKKDEQPVYQDAINLTADAIESYLRDGIQKTMTAFNKRKDT